MAYTQNQDRMQDDSMVLHDATAAITADALATVGGSAAAGIVDLGNGVHGMYEAVMEFSAVDVASADEDYRIQILGSNSATFASGIVLLTELHLGDSSKLAGGTGGVDTDKGAGQYNVPFRNRIGATNYRYVRLNFEVGGTTPSITPATDLFLAQIGTA